TFLGPLQWSAGRCHTASSGKPCASPAFAADVVRKYLCGRACPPNAHLTSAVCRRHPDNRAGGTSGPTQWRSLFPGHIVSLVGFPYKCFQGALAATSLAVASLQCFAR